MPADAEGILHVDHAAGEIRRRLGPASWMVFEELLLAATTTGGAWQATLSVRVLAERTGMSKDTVARAVGRLRRAGLVTLHQRRDAGLFAAGVYELTIPNGITIATKPNPSVNQPRASRDQTSVTQLSLLAIEP